MPRLTTENTNSRAHRLTGDTLVYECQRCEWGEIAVTELIENDAARCPDCDARYEISARSASER